ncbi:MAG TPA: helix-hairpin-helix domain-containing protein, partial [Mycobacteriales bacterium]|nr:helix-hairpin-helix domain-containing protein [Mycobacteriales bacterium]
MSVEEGMLARFAAAGLWPGFPRRALDELRRTGFARIDDVDATALLALTGIGPVTAPRLVRALTDRTDAYDIAVLLDAAGMPLRGADRLAKELGAGAGEALRGNPWRLLAAPERSLSDADRLAAGLGLTRDHPLRGPAVVGYLLTRVAVHGHTAWPVDQLCREAAAHGVADPAAAIEQAVATGAVVTVTDTAALNRYDGAERTLANDLIRLARTAQDWSRPGGTRR